MLLSKLLLCSFLVLFIAMALYFFASQFLSGFNFVSLGFLYILWLFVVIISYAINDCLLLIVSMLSISREVLRVSCHELVTECREASLIDH